MSWRAWWRVLWAPAACLDRLASAAEARERVGWAVRADRDCAGDGRWVRQPSALGFWVLAGAGACMHLGMALTMRRVLRPRYRWEARR